MSVLDTFGGGKAGPSIYELQVKVWEANGQPVLSPDEWLKWQYARATPFQIDAEAPDWTADHTYEERAAARYQGSLYAALRETTGEVPPDSPEAWVLVVPGIDQGLYDALLSNVDTVRAQAVADVEALRLAAAESAGVADSKAVEAGQAAELAEQERAAAEVARGEVQSIAAAAISAASFFDTIAEGRAAVVDGASFGVRAGGADALEAPTIYRRDSATTQTPLVQLADSAAVAALRARLGVSDNDRLAVFYDSEGKATAYMDEAAEWFMSRLGSKSLQQHVLDGAARIAEAGAAIDSVERVASPALKRSTSAEGHVYELVDEFGNWFIPRLGSASVQDHILQMRDKFAELPGNAVNKMLERRRVYDAVHDFGVPNDGITNASPSTQAAINRLSSQANILGPSVLYFREGIYRLDAFITPASNVTIVGAGWGKSRFLPTGIQSAFLRNSSTLMRANFIDVEIDGAEQFYEGGARVSTKGMFFQRWADCQFLRVYIHDVWATGLGIDFSAGHGPDGQPGGSWIIDGRFEGCGRGSQFNDPGSSGIGIGTGQFEKEPLIISRNICRGNRNFGIFLERQHQAADIYVARQNIIADNICSENGGGIGEVGAGGTVLNGNQCNDNILHGIYMYGGTIPSNHEGPHPGIETMVAENVCTGNGGDGLRWDGTLNKPTITTGFYTDHNQFHRNGGAGVRLIGKTDQEMSDFALRNDEIKGNGAGGIMLQQGIFRAFDILHPRLIDNTGPALQIDAALTDSRILGLTARSTLATALQTTAIVGSGALTRVDISECIQTDHATPSSLTGPRTNVTFGRNPGFAFS